MIRTRDTRFVLSSLVPLAAAAVPSAGQPVQLMRFEPPVATRVHSIVSSEITMEVVGVGTARHDTVRLGARRLESVTRFVDYADGGFYSILLQYDSVRVRVERFGSLWTDRAASVRELESVRAVLDARMSVVSAEFDRRPDLPATQTELVRGLAGGIHFTLPATEVSPGSSWVTELRVSLMTLTGLEVPQGIPTSGEMTTQSRITLDSVSVVSRDTLSYLTVRGDLASGSLRSGGGTNDASFDGWVSATMVWSTSWDAFVTAAIRTRLWMGALAEPDRTSGSRVRFDVITQFQVRM